MSRTSFEIRRPLSDHLSKLTFSEVVFAFVLPRKGHKEQLDLERTPA